MPGPGFLEALWSAATRKPGPGEVDEIRQQALNEAIALAPGAGAPLAAGSMRVAPAISGKIQGSKSFADALKWGEELARYYAPNVLRGIEKYVASPFGKGGYHILNQPADQMAALRAITSRLFNKAGHRDIYLARGVLPEILSPGLRPYDAERGMSWTMDPQFARNHIGVSYGTYGRAKFLEELVPVRELLASNTTQPYLPWAAGESEAIRLPRGFLAALQQNKQLQGLPDAPPPSSNPSGWQTVEPAAQGTVKPAAQDLASTPLSAEQLDEAIKYMWQRATDFKDTKFPYNPTADPAFVGKLNSNDMTTLWFAFMSKLRNLAEVKNPPPILLK